METELIERILEIHLQNMVEEDVILCLNASELLSLAELIEATVDNFPLNEIASVGLEELAGIFRDMAIEAYPEIEPYCDRVSIFEEKI